MKHNCTGLRNRADLQNKIITTKRDRRTQLAAGDMLISVHWVVSILIGTSLVVLVESRLVGQNDAFLGIGKFESSYKGEGLV